LSKKIYLGEGKGKLELERAWLDVYQHEIDKGELHRYLAFPKGQISYIGQKNDTEVYWVALGKSKQICKQAWADLWPILGDCIVTWEMIESE
jgi:hypothetical protein